MENNKGNTVMDRSSNTAAKGSSNPDVVLIGAGIMSATLAVILKELDPNLNIEIYEVLGSPAEESSNAWNNAGTASCARQRRSLSGRPGFVAGRGAHEIALRCCCCNGAGVEGRNEAVTKLFAQKTSSLATSNQTADNPDRYRCVPGFQTAHCASSALGLGRSFCCRSSPIASARSRGSRVRGSDG
jgi:hypothetical protein